jgi:hypothetical protein
MWANAAVIFICAVKNKGQRQALHDMITACRQGFFMHVTYCNQLKNYNQ